MPARCHSIFDDGGFEHLTFEEIQNLTTSLPCGEHTPESDKLDACNACDLTGFNISDCADYNSFGGRNME